MATSKAATITTTNDRPRKKENIYTKNAKHDSLGYIGEYTNR